MQLKFSKIYYFFQQKTYKKITPGREEVLALQKSSQILKKCSEY